MPLTAHPTGNDRFLPGIAPYSCGVISSPGFEIVYVTLREPVPYRDGFELIARYLTEAVRPLTALCAISLRSPLYISRLRRLQLRIRLASCDSGVSSSMA